MQCPGPIHGSALPYGALDRPDDAWISPAATEIRAHVLDDLITCRAGIVLEQIGRAHDLAGLAVAALRDPFCKPALLHRVRRIRRQPLDRRHRAVCDLRYWSQARKGAVSIKMDHAGAALSNAASKLGPGELELFPDDPQQRRRWRRVGRDSIPVHGKTDRHAALLAISVTAASRVSAF